MKRKTLFACFLALTMTLGLAACGGSAGTKAADSAAYANTSAAESAPMERELGFDTVEESYDAVQTGSDVLRDQKIIYTGELRLETTEFDTAVRGLTELTETLGGYLQSSTLGSGGQGYRRADYVVRVPSEQFQSFLAQAGTLAHVTRQNTELENITESYYDTQGRLKTQQIKLERLQNLLSQAENMEDIITIESAISETEWSIESLSGTLRHYDALVDYATVNVHISEVYKLSDTELVPESFGDRLGSAFTRGLSAFWDGVEDFTVALAYSWLWIVLWAAILVGAVLLGRKAFGRRERKKRAKTKAGSDAKQDDKPDQT